MRTLVFEQAHQSIIPFSRSLKSGEDYVYNTARAFAGKLGPLKLAES